VPRRWRAGGPDETAAAVFDLAAGAESALTVPLDRATIHGGGFAVLRHSEWSRDVPFEGSHAFEFRLVDGVRARGGVPLWVGQLAIEAWA
jgi:hypothetical protein